MTEQNKIFAGAGGGGSKSVKNDASTLYSTASIQILDLISEGQIGGLVDGAKSIYFDDVPLQNSNGTYNYDDVEVREVKGTPDQDVIRGWESATMSKNVSVEVSQANPVVQAITETNIDKVRCSIAIPQLYYVADDGMKRTSIEFRFAIAINSDGFVDQGLLKISGKTTSQYQKSYTFKLPQRDSKGKPPSRWLIKLTKVSEDAGDKYVASLQWQAMFLVAETQLNYPNSAIIGLSASAENVSSIPTRSYLVDGLIIKVPSNYDKKTNTYNGVWNGTFKMEVSSNPAWILYALLTNERWGLGEFIKPEQINKAKLYEIGRYCDEFVDNGFGVKEKRFEINTQITQRSEAYELIQSITNVFRGMAFWAMGHADFTCDKPTEPTMLYTQANVVDGLFNYMGSSRNDRHSVALVTWNDPEQNYKQVVEYVEDPELVERYGIRQTEFTAFGCTSRGQAIRAGRWILYSEKYESDLITFNVGLDSALVLPGDVIKIHDPYHAGKRLGGRLLNSTKTSATFDREVELDPNAHPKISIRLPDGTFEERTLLITQKEPIQTVYWDEPLSQQPLDLAIWIVTEENLVPITARVVNINQGEDKGTYTIECLSHNPGKYDLIEKDIAIVEPPTSSIDPRKVGIPTNFAINVSTYKNVFGILAGQLDLSWTPGINNVSYVLEWRTESEEDGNSEWTTIESNSPYVTIKEAENGLYHFILYAKGLLGNYSEVVEAYYDSENTLPSADDVQDFVVIKRTEYLELRWSAVKNAVGYELRVGESWDNSDVIVTNYTGTSFIHDQDEAGTYYYHIRAINSDGTMSRHVKTFELVLNAPICPRDFIIVRSNERLELKWRTNPEPDITYYEIREGLNWAASTPICQSKLNHATIPVGAQTRRKFWIKAVASPGIYSVDAAWYEIGVTNDQNKNIIIEQHERTLGWPSHKVYMEERFDDLFMIDDIKRCEYIVPVNLYRKNSAHNSFSVGINTVVCSTEDNETWEMLDQDFDSLQAQRQWVMGANVDSIVGYKQIATQYGLASNDFEGIALENNCVSLNKKEPVMAHEAYDLGRYSNGFAITPTTYAGWQGLANERLFRFSFWFKVAEQTPNSVIDIMRMTTSDGANEMRIVYDTRTKEMMLKCTDGKNVTLKTDFLANDYYCFAIYQTEKNRGFGFGILGKETQLQDVLATPMGDFTDCYIGNC